MAFAVSVRPLVCLFVLDNTLPSRTRTGLIQGEYHHDRSQRGISRVGINSCSIARYRTDGRLHGSAEYGSC